MAINPVVVDSSHWDDVQDWTAVANSIWGFINKATQGTGVIDKTFAIRRQPAADHGILYGAFHWITRRGRIQDQVDHFLNTVKPDNRLLLALDYEERGVTLDSAQEFMTEVYARIGRYPVLYSGFLIKEANPGRFWSAPRLWLAQYTTEPTWPSVWTRPWLWQFTGDGVGPGPHQIPGIATDNGLDLNSYDGTRDDLEKEWAS